MVLLTCSVDIIKRDITQFSYDVIVNACNRKLDGNHGVSKDIHIAAGPKLLQACQSLGGCETGDAKITKGYNLSKYVIHTVGPHDLDQRKLRRCYTKSLSLAEEHGCSSIVFPCIATGPGRKYNTYREEAAIIALVAVRDYVMDKQRQGKKLPFVSIVFCVYSGKDEEIYNRHYPKYFNRKPNYVVGQQNHPVQVATISYQEARPQNPVYMANGGQSHYNNVPRQQNHHFQMAPIDHRDNGPQKPDDTTYGDQRYYNDRVAPRDRRDNGHQKPHDATNGDQIYYSDCETNYVTRQQHYPVEVAHVGYRDYNFQKPDTTDGGQRNHHMRQSRNR